MRKISPRLLALMMAGAVTVTSITPVTGYQTITVNAATDSQEKEAAQGYQTNLTGFDYKKGDWKETKDGLYSNAVDKGDCFAFSKTTAKNFVYSATFLTLFYIVFATFPTIFLIILQFF